MESKKRIDDRTLVQMFKNGDHSAFDVIADRYFDLIDCHVSLIIKDPIQVEDIIQDTLVKAMVSILNDKYEERGTLKQWLLRIAHNFCIDFLRKRKKRFDTLSLSLTDNLDEDELNQIYLALDQELNPEERMINKETSKFVQGLIDNLPVNLRETFTLRTFHGFSFKEIAERSNVSINTALGRMLYARINLRRKINKLNSQGEKILPIPPT